MQIDTKNIKSKIDCWVTDNEPVNIKKLNKRIDFDDTKKSKKIDFYSNIQENIELIENSNSKIF